MNQSFIEACKLYPEEIYLVSDSFGGWGVCVSAPKQESLWLNDESGQQRIFKSADEAIAEAQILATRAGKSLTLKISLLAQKTGH